MDEWFRRPLRVHQDEIGDEFDFEKVRKTMEFLGWHWLGAEEGVPTNGELRRQVRDLMAQAYDYATKSGKDYWIATGGFVVEYKVVDDAFEVMFCLTQWNTYNLKGGPF